MSFNRGYFLKTGEVINASGANDFNGLAFAKGFLTVFTTGASAHVRIDGNHDPAVFPWQSITALVPITGAGATGVATAIISANYGYLRAVVISAYSGAAGSASVDAFMSMVR